jgi:sulfopyruvate decarboxylase subunit beta
MASVSRHVPTDARMSCEEALRVLAAARSPRHLVITNQMSARLWPHLSQQPLDFPYLSSTMGGAVPLGLGIALARPDLEIVVVSGDGSLLMNLGCLVTVTSSRAANLTVILLDNGLYEVTGGQRTPAARAPVDYTGLARSAGFPATFAFDQLAEWDAQATACLDAPGPRLVALRVAPVLPDTPRCTSTQVHLEIARLRSYLQDLRP